MQTRYMKLCEAAAYVNASTRTVQRWIDRGVLCWVTIAGNLRRIDREQIDALVSRPAQKDVSGIVTPEEEARFVIPFRHTGTHR